MRCIAVDDEPWALQLLEDNIKKLPYLELVASCGDSFEALKVLQENTIDLVFLDIQMPGLTGLQFVNSLQYKPLIIFITAYKEYAIESYDLSVVDYLVKPVAIERFIKACNRAKELFELNALKQQPKQVTNRDFFFVNADYSQVKVIFSDIIWMEGLRDYIKIYLKSTSKPLLIRTSFKAIEPELPSALFIRIHKSYIVSVESIHSIRKNSVFIKEMELPVSENYRTAVEQLMRR